MTTLNSLGFVIGAPAVPSFYSFKRAVRQREGDQIRARLEIHRRTELVN